MSTIDEDFHAAVTAVLESPAVRRLALKRVFEDQGILFSPYQLRRLEVLLRHGASTDARRFRFREDQLTAQASEGARRSRYLQADPDALDYHMQQIAAEMFERFDVLGLADETARPIFKALKRDAQAMREDRARTLLGFERRLNRIWGKANNLLEMLLVICLEVGQSFNEEERPSASAGNDHEFEALVRLHAKACQISAEILVLLRAGHADGAMARWRALYEVTAVGWFIKKQGGDIAERYLLHQVVEAYKAAREQQRFAADLGEPPMPEGELESMRHDCDQLVARFGDPYREDLGWAAAALKNRRPSITDIGRTAGLEHWRPYYRMASLGVHANPQGVYFQLGLPSDDPDVLVAGASNVGLADPGHATAISLEQITIALLTSKSTMERLVICAVLRSLEPEIGEEFIKAHRGLEG